MKCFISTRDGECYYRTKLLRSQRRAAAFCRMIAANPRRFQKADVVPSNQADGWFVQYQPSSAARRADLYYQQYRQRELKAKTEGPCYTFDLCTTHPANPFYRCLSVSGEVYEVTEKTCTCRDWQFRGKKSGLPCKHIQAYHAAVAMQEIVALFTVRLSARLAAVSAAPPPCAYAA